jgi:hypothetical protein
MPCVTVWHHVADLQGIRVGKLENGKLLAPVLDAQHRKVGARILQYQRGLELAFVGERNLHLVRTLDDMIIGHDQTRGIDDHARAKGPLQLTTASARHTEEAAEDRIVQQRIAILHHLGGINIDHGWRHMVHHRRIRQAQLRLRGKPPLLCRGGARNGDGNQDGG